MIHLKTFDNSNSVIPECEDVCADTEPFLRPNIIKGSNPDVDTYLDIQFRILQDLRVSNSTTENGNNEDDSRSEKGCFDIRLNPELCNFRVNFSWQKTRLHLSPRKL